MAAPNSINMAEKPAGYRIAGLKPALPAVLICLTLNLALLAGIGVKRPTYLTNFHENANPDANHYVQLGRNVLLLGIYSRQAEPPYVPDMVRTPVYPLFAGGLDLLAGPWLIYLSQAFLQAGSCLLLFLIIRSLFGERAAFWGSLILASDLMLVIYNFEAMSEPLFNFLVLASIACLTPSLVSLIRAAHVWIGSTFLGGVLLGLAILTRPAGLYLPVVLCAGLLTLGCKSKRFGATLACLLAFLTGVVPLPALWIARNAKVCSVPRLATVDAVCSVYFAGGGAYQLRHDISLIDAHGAIAQEYGLPRHEEAMNPWISQRSIAEMDSALRNASFPVMARYPKELIISSILGVMKASFSHNTSVLAELLDLKWLAPGTADLLHLRPEAVARLWANGSLLDVVFFWQLFHVSLTLGLALAGIFTSLRCATTRSVTLLLLAVLGYFYLTVAMFGFEAFYRCRVPVLPFLYVFAAVGMSRLAAMRSRTVFTQTVEHTQTMAGGAG